MKETKPHPLKARTAEEMAQIPHYLMEKDKGGGKRPSYDTFGRLYQPARMADRGRSRSIRNRVQLHRFHQRAARLSRRRGTDPRSIAETQTFSGRSTDVPA